MNLTWPLAVVIVAMLLFGYCVYATNRTTDSVERVLDESLTAQQCYSAGYEVGSDGEEEGAPPEDDECARWFGLGYADGQRLYEAFR